MRTEVTRLWAATTGIRGYRSARWGASIRRSPYCVRALVDWSATIAFKGFNTSDCEVRTMSIPSFAIGIAGGTGAGKTTVSRNVADAVGEPVTRLPLDNYYEDLSHLPSDERESVNYDHPSAFEWDLLYDHLESLLLGQPIEMPQYDFEVHNRTDERITVEPTDVIVLEGILALYDDRIREMLDLRVYVMTDADVRILRRIERDVVDRGRDLEGVIEQYLETVKPMHERFVAPTRKNADVIIPEGANRMAVDLLIDKIEAELDDDRADRRRELSFDSSSLE
ncbi:Uridine kinase [Natrarchaeobaculum sulfurireducens]|uniref:Uridine kinase n=2 Tax=Natrarchaeobaculum sulfurireducens TaxID=2044521 RepID=A0A346PNN2_9EURY|nr:Uridine kinase [Natrarchaeobaculum sulfurireducens]